MRTNTSPYVLERIKLLRFIGIDFFPSQIALYHGIAQGDRDLEVQNALFSKRRQDGTKNLKNDLFIGHVQPFTSFI